MRKRLFRTLRKNYSDEIKFYDICVFMKNSNNYYEFRKFLQNEFLERIQRNPYYSLRAYAKFLTLNDSTLSKILNGKLKISDKRFEDLSDKFNLTLE